MRLISGPEEFRAVHGSSPLTEIIGFDPWSGTSALELPALIEWLHSTLYSPCMAGILPDIMHLAHLAIFPDVFISVLLDITDEVPKRETKLTELYENYRDWCESQSNPATFSSYINP